MNSRGRLIQEILREQPTKKYLKTHPSTGSGQAFLIHLFKLAEYLSPVCRPHNRILDEYGYAVFQANYYWVPEYDRKKNRLREVKIMEYAKHIELYHGITQLVRYDLPPDGIRNERFAPPGVSLRYKPRRWKKKNEGEEKDGDGTL